MSLGLRFVLAISSLVALISVGLSFAVRGAWHTFEERQFERQFSAATERLKVQLDKEVATLPRQLAPLCTHGEMVNSALTDLEAGQGEIAVDRQYALSALALETMKSFGFDEFLLFTNKGKVLGSNDAARVGTIERALSTLGENSPTATLRLDAGQPQLAAHCLKRSRQFGVGIYAARHFATLLQDVSLSSGLKLSLTRPLDPSGSRSVELQQLPGTPVFAKPKRALLDASIRELNRTIFLWGSLTLAVSLLLGFVFARRLARPIEQLASRVGSAKPLAVSGGGKEIKHLAESFNQAIDDLARLRKRLKTTERIAAQREIARRVAHEIKNPLAPIRAAVETLRRLRRRGDPAFDDYFDEASQTVLDEVKRITTIINEFTEFARLPAPNPEWFDLRAITRKVATLNQKPAVSLRLIDGEPVNIRADEDQLIQILTNLLQNATEAVAGREDARVEVELQVSAGDRVHLRVADNGDGVAEAIEAQLFTPYITTKRDGTGLGLSIVQRIVLEHEGEISCGRAKLGGAEFNVYLPVGGPNPVQET